MITCFFEDGGKANLRHITVNDNPDRPKEDRQNWVDLDKIPPLDQIAFDHGEHIELYKNYLKNKFPIPLLGKLP